MILNYFILFFIIMIRYTIFNWYNTNKYKLIESSTECYKNLGIFVPMTSIVTFTSYGNYLFLYVTLYEIYYETIVQSYIWCTTWVILFLSNILYYIIIFPTNIKNIDSKVSEPILFKILDHGPALFLFLIKFMSIEKNDIYFNIENLIYPIYFGIFWLFIIWLPWYNITGDYVYNILSCKNSIKFRCCLILSIILSIIPAFYIGFLFEKYIMT